MPDISLIVDNKNELGESPVWDAIEQRLYWVDIKGKTINWHHPASGETRTVDVTEEPGCIGLRDSGGLVVGFWGGFRFFDMETGEIETIHDLETDIPDSRMNDGRCDRQGRFWAGSMDDTFEKPVGSLYRLDPDLTCHLMEPDITISNSIAFSPDGTTMYFADFRQETIWAYDLDTATGDITNKRVFAGEGSAPGAPDGSIVDAEGYLWNARWGGSCIARFAPDGTLDRTVEVPVNQPTCPMFGGPDLDILYITSAWFRLSAEDRGAFPEAGGIHAIMDIGVAGLPEPRFAG